MRGYLDSEEIVGTIGYVAPELFNQPGPGNERVDIWALGLLTLGFLYHIPSPPLSRGDVFGPNNPFADGWRGIVRSAVKTLVNVIRSQGKCQAPFESIRIIPRPDMMLILDGLLQIDPVPPLYCLWGSDMSSEMLWR